MTLNCDRRLCASLPAGGVLQGLVQIVGTLVKALSPRSRPSLGCTTECRTWQSDNSTQQRLLAANKLRIVLVRYVVVVAGASDRYIVLLHTAPETDTHAHAVMMSRPDDDAHLGGGARARIVFRCARPFR